MQDIQNAFEIKRLATQNNLVYSVYREIALSKPHGSCPVFQEPLIEEASFAPLYILASFVKDKVPIGAWVYL